MPMDRTPTHHDAELVLRLYDLRREPVMRENRARLLRELWPKRVEDLLDVLKTEPVRMEKGEIASVVLRKE